MVGLLLGWRRYELFASNCMYICIYLIWIIKLIVVDNPTDYNRTHYILFTMDMINSIGSNSYMSIFQHLYYNIHYVTIWIYQIYQYRDIN
jgi:hypothetical protein